MAYGIYSNHIPRQWLVVSRGTRVGWAGMGAASLGLLATGQYFDVSSADAIYLGSTAAWGVLWSSDNGHAGCRIRDDNTEAVVYIGGFRCVFTAGTYGITSGRVDETVSHTAGAWLGWCNDGFIGASYLQTLPKSFQEQHAVGPLGLEVVFSSKKRKRISLQLPTKNKNENVKLKRRRIWMSRAIWGLCRIVKLIDDVYGASGMCSSSYPVTGSCRRIGLWIQHQQ